MNILPFSETWLISLASRPDRYQKIRKQISWFGWDVKDHITVIHPWCDKIMQDCIEGGYGYLNSPNAYSCTREHYTLIKSAYLRGLESICIIEDDVSFYLYPNVWEEYLKNLPKDWDILRLCSLRGKIEEDYIEENYKNSLWIPAFNGQWGTGCYALSRKGMKYMIDSIDNFLQPIDNPLFNFDQDSRIKQYIPKIPLGLCLEDSLESDINGIAPCSLYFKDIKSLRREDYTLKPGIVFYIAHEINDFTKAQYLKLKSQLPGGYDLIWWLDDSCRDIRPGSIKFVRFPHDSINNTGGYISPTRYFEKWWEKEKPKYSFYWFIEYDVYFSGRWDDLILRVDLDYPEKDLVASYVNTNENTKWGHWKEDIKYKQIKSCLSVYRLTERGAKMLCFWNKDNIKNYIYELYIPTVIYHSGGSIVSLDQEESDKLFREDLDYVNTKNYYVGKEFTNPSQMSEPGKLYTTFKKLEEK